MALYSNTSLQWISFFFHFWKVVEGAAPCCVLLCMLTQQFPGWGKWAPTCLLSPEEGYLCRVHQRCRVSSEENSKKVSAASLSGLRGLWGVEGGRGESGDRVVSNAGPSSVTGMLIREEPLRSTTDLWGFGPPFCSCTLFFCF